jgi:hypothetical protein
MKKFVGEEFVERFIDLAKKSLNENGFDLIYCDTIETKNGTFDVEVKITNFNNE